MTKPKLVPIPRVKNTHLRIKSVISQVIGKRVAISLPDLKKELEKKLNTKLRMDYLVCTLLGEDYLLDCKSRIVVKN